MVVCIKNMDKTGRVPWTKEGHYHKLQVVKVYEGDFIEKSWGGKKHIVVYLKEFDFFFQTPWWFLLVEEWREIQLEKLFNN